jgi:nicotinamidase/pyrazinamidase
MSRALIVVDYQNDFAAPDGALAVPGGEEIAPRINALASSGDFEFVVATRDWHPPDHGSFVTSDSAGPWPVHCVAGTPGAELHPVLDLAAVDLVLDKGTDPATEGYSAFDATGLADLLRERGVDELLVTGLATDYCVRHTALDALAEGFAVRVELDAVRGVDVKVGDADRALEEIRAAGADVS